MAGPPLVAESVATVANVTLAKSDGALLLQRISPLDGTTGYSCSTSMLTFSSARQTPQTRTIASSVCLCCPITCCSTPQWSGGAMIRLDAAPCMWRSASLEIRGGAVIDRLNHIMSNISLRRHINISHHATVIRPSDTCGIISAIKQKSVQALLWRRLAFRVRLFGA